MEQDKEKTKVQFYIHKENKELFAYFPEEREHTEETIKHLTSDKSCIDNLLDLRLCYAHLGQHSSCCSDYVKESRKATKKEYQELFNELTNIGYNLELV